MTSSILILCALVCSAGDSPRERIDPCGPAGSLVICGGGALPDSVIDRFIELAGGKEARLVVIPTASGRADEESDESLLGSWNDRELAQVTLLHTRSREEANRPDFVAPLKTAAAVWFGGGAQSRIAEAYLGTAVERELGDVLRRGGVIGGSSAGAAIQSQLMIARGNPVPEIGVGFDLLPGAVIDQHFLKRNRGPRLWAALSDHPSHVGFGIDEGTALIARGRRLEVLGRSSVTVCLAASEARPRKTVELRSGQSADLTALRRAACARAEASFPPEKMRPPVVAHGTLILGGGGRMPDEVIRTFVEAAGGPDAPIVVLPTAASDPLPERLSAVEMLEESGARNVVSLRERTLEDVESDSFLATLRQARGLWFSGGRQWRLVDAYEDTQAYDLFHDVLRRGGAVGGSSAGASIQAEYMVRGNPLGNREIMAEGYERGFAFLPGSAVDQHFSSRDRSADMTRLVDTYPQVLGIGIDESTALVVSGSVARVVGENHVYFYDRTGPLATEQPDSIKIGHGERFDMLTHTVTRPGAKPDSGTQQRE